MNKAFIFLILAVVCVGLTDLSAQPTNPQSGVAVPGVGNIPTNGIGTAGNSAGSGTSAGTPRATAAPGAQPLPTTQQLGQMLDQKDYVDVVKETQRILRAKNVAAAYDKADLDTLRGEAQIGMKQQSNAITSFNLAAKDATDPAKSGYAKAMVTLIQQSHAFLYTPKANPADPTRQTTPLDIIDPVTRKQALAALFVDEWTPAQKKIDQLKKQTTSLPPLLEAATLVGEMRGLEIAGTDSDTQTSKALSDLDESAARLMNDYIERNDKHVDDIQVLANASIQSGLYGNSNQRQGLNGTQTSDLKDIVNTTAKLSLAAKQVAAAAGDKGQDFSQIAAKSDDLHKKALDVLNTDFNQPLQGNGTGVILNNPNGTNPNGTTPNGVQRGNTTYHH